ncbi:MAG: transaldolase [Caldilineaceae bacterium]|nr:transaldolase [Caldilineaceae bacterium]
MNRMQKLLEIGQSIWLDFIDRESVQTDKLAKMVEDGIRGVTSNPTIFQQAIAKSDDYDADLADLRKQGKSPKEMFEAVAVADIQAAADILAPIYKESGGKDGFVSIEVAPDLADDTDATIEEARRLHNSVDRPNVMVKVPATKAGIPAIRRLISEGININVTLIFSLERYAAVKEAYFQGLEDRLEQGEAIDNIASVASFFVSRVDSNVDEKLKKVKSSNGTDPKALMGKTALANAKLAYAQFQEKFAGERWEKLAAKGAQLQRPLWASTSVKNPDYPDLLYVEPLMGPHTVNTMPTSTLEAFQDHGDVAARVEEGVPEAELVFTQLAALGISMDQVTDELEKEGVKKFADSYDDLLATIAKEGEKVAA